MGKPAVAYVGKPAQMNVSKPPVVYLAGLLQIVSALSHIFYEGPLIACLGVFCGITAVACISAVIVAQDMETVMVVVLSMIGATLIILTLLIIIAFFMRIYRGIREFIVAVRLMMGRKTAYGSSKAMAKGDIWSIFLLNFISVIAGIVCWIILEVESVRRYYSTYAT